MNGNRWQSPATELAELVRTVGPRVALAGIVLMLLFGVPLVAWCWAHFPRVGV